MKIPTSVPARMAQNGPVGPYDLAVAGSKISKPNAFTTK